MEYGRAVMGFIEREQDIILLCVAVLALVLLVSLFALARKVRKLGRTAGGVVDGETARALRDGITQCARQLAAVSARLDAAEQRQTELSSQLEKCVQRIGFVRFDAFEDVGGEQSFALAALDAKNNGVVLSNLFSRVDSRIYAKRVTAGASEHNMSAEEQEAVRKAAPL